MRCWRIDPEAEESTTSGVIMTNSIVSVCHPECSRLLIRIQHRTRWSGENTKIVLDSVLLLEAIFNEEVVTLASVRHVPLKESMMRAVNCHCTVECVMDTQTTEV